MVQEVLVALLKEKSDFAILRDQGWYRIPVDRAPKRWPPEYMAFYQPRVFGDDAYRIRYFGRVASIETVARRELFPNEFESAKSVNRYYRIKLEKLEERESSIPSLAHRRIVFVSTTMKKFRQAEEFNDLFDESPLEERLWQALKSSKIPAERQFEFPIQGKFFQLDFAVFCNEGQIDAEADGDTWHAERVRIDKDNERNNSLTASGWQVLRFNGKQIQENQARFCVGEIEKTINKLGGLTTDGLVPRKFYPADGEAQQLSLFE